VEEEEEIDEPEEMDSSNEPTSLLVQAPVSRKIRYKVRMIHQRIKGH
jgi:hypothetical protein